MKRYTWAPLVSRAFTGADLLKLLKAASQDSVRQLWVESGLSADIDPNRAT